MARLRSTPGVEYVHPNFGVHILRSDASAQNAEAAAPDSSKSAATESAATDAAAAGSGESAQAANQAQTTASSDPAAPDSAASDASGASKTAYAPEVAASAGSAAPASSDSSQIAAASTAATIKANDPELPKQLYLNQIGVPKAWQTARNQTGLTIAIVDTGVDLDHPDLKGNLVPGKNLVDPEAPPEDDNGHGTSVAGIIGAVGNNKLGIAGILWNAKIMPIKALDDRGDGTEQELGEGILYAVRNGAKIVVLSVGLHRYSPYMLDIVEYAESKGVLLVAAAGNDGQSLGSKAAVKYPAAYPTVLAVGGVKANNTADPRSNPGSELDLAAPWNVFTTAVGGLYKKEEGTSMAAPQAAAAAALVWASHKSLKPYQIRELLRQTAKDIGAAGVDRSSGYGVLQVDQAVRASLKPDRFEPNGTSGTASGFPLQTQLSAVLNGASDQDWYAIEVPYDGTLTIRYEGLVPSGKAVPPVRTTHFANGKQQAFSDTKLASRSMDFKVKKGKQLIKLALLNQSAASPLPYKLTSSFTMKADDYEQNDKSYEATTLQPRTQSVTGNFHQTADRDWFAVTFKQGGKLSLTLSANTARIDPGLAVQKAGQQLTLYDDEGEGETENSPVITVTPGKYYIRVHNAISSEASPTIGTYKLEMDYTPIYDDPNEPNDKSYEAFLAKPGTEYVGVIGSYSDTDWFQYRTAAQSIVSLAITGVPADRNLKLTVYDKRMKQLTTASTGASGKLQTEELRLGADVYYVKLAADAPFDKQYYRLKIKSEELVAGYRDIKNHWAENEIVELNKRGIISGTGESRFEPKRAITRAEAVAMVVKAYKPPASGPAQAKTFKDVKAGHWASDAIKRAVQQGWVKGYPDGSFKPDQPVTRAEMAFIIGYADGIKPKLPVVNPFDDVKRSAWSAPMLFAMKQSGIIEGIEDGLFKPNQKASRADFTVLLHRIIT
ncbi:S8 family serine peptidase [Paenibacillus sp. N4]|nr:S8 family serine peptidase [Paenibacillus vietnamensis]